MAITIKRAAVAALMLAAVVLWLGCDEGPRGNAAPAGESTADAPSTTTRAADTIRIGVVPEQDIFKLHSKYRVLADYLSRKLGQPVEIVTLNTYAAVLDDFQQHDVDAAFLGSLVSVLAMDRFNATVLLKPEQTDGASAYRGMIIVRDDSPLRSIDDLRGRTIAMLRTTYAGSLFPIAELAPRKMLLPAGHAATTGPGQVRITWAGTHDEAIDAVVSGRVDAAAVKDLRLIAYQQRHPQARFRVLKTCDPVPNNALVVRGDLSGTLGPRLEKALLAMESDPDAAAAREAMGIERFLHCHREQYKAIDDMVEIVGPYWDLVGVSGPPPKRPATR